MSDNDRTKVLGVTMPKAKRSKIVRDLSAQLRGKHLQDSTTVFGTKYTLRTLEPLEERWADQFIPGASMLQIGRGQSAPYVARALVAIDDVPVESHFLLPDEMDPDIREALAISEAIMDDWRRRQILDWLLEDTQPEVVRALFSFYSEMCERKAKALEAIGPLSGAQILKTQEPSSATQEKTSTSGTTPTTPNGDFGTSGLMSAHENLSSSTKLPPMLTPI